MNYKASCRGAVRLTAMLIVLYAHQGEKTMAGEPRNVVELCIYDSWVPLDDNALNAFEVLIGDRLPKEYRKFLKRFNGGALPSHVRYEVPRKYADGSVNSAGVQLFFSLNCPTDLSYMSLESEYRTHRLRIPDNTIPIGTTGEDLTLLDTKSGEVIYWIRDDELEVADPNDNRHLIGASFAEYISNYYVSSMDERRQDAIERKNPFILVETHDNEAFNAWMAGLDGGLVSYSKLDRVFEVACLNRNVHVAKALLDAGVDSAARETLIAIDKGACWDIAILAFERGGTFDLLQNSAYQPQSHALQLESVWKSGGFGHRDRADPTRRR